MAKADAGAVDIELVGVVPAPAFQHRQHLRCKGFVQFDQINIIPCHAGPREQPLHRRHRADAHARRVAAGRRPAGQPGHGFKAQRFQQFFGHHQASRRPVVLLAGVAGGHHAVLLDGLQQRQAFGRCIGADALVRRKDDGRALLLRDFHRHQFIDEFAVCPSLGGALVALRGIGIAFFAADAIILGQIVGGFNHA